jgi:hypothetical protein
MPFAFVWPSEPPVASGPRLAGFAAEVSRYYAERMPALRSPRSEISRHVVGKARPHGSDILPARPTVSVATDSEQVTHNFTPTTCVLEL